MSATASQIARDVMARWEKRNVPTFTARANSQTIEVVPVSFLQEAFVDMGRLITAIGPLTTSEKNARRKLRRQRKLKRSLGDGPAKGVAEQALPSGVGAKAQSDPLRHDEQSQSVSSSLAPVIDAGGRIAVGQTTGSGDLADAKARTPVEGRQSLHPPISASDAA